MSIDISALFKIARCFGPKNDTLVVKLVRFAGSFQDIVGHYQTVLRRHGWQKCT